MTRSFGQERNAVVLFLKFLPDKTRFPQFASKMLQNQYTTLYIAFQDKMDPGSLQKVTFILPVKPDQSAHWDYCDV